MSDLARELWDTATMMNRIAAEECATPAKIEPPQLTRDEWDDIYMDCESNGEGEARSMCRYAYEAGWKAAKAAK